MTIEALRSARVAAPVRLAESSVPLHPLLAERWSTRSFAPDVHLTDAELLALLEAARWAPSRSNGQTRRFLVGRRGDDTFTRIYDALKPQNQAWAGNAAALIAGVAPVADAEGEVDRLGAYDLGQAIAHLSVQATALGLHVRQMAGFHPDVIRSAFSIPQTHAPLVVAAVGAYGDPSILDEGSAEKERAARQRHPVAAIAFADAWESPLPVVGNAGK